MSNIEYQKKVNTSKSLLWRYVRYVLLTGVLGCVFLVDVHIHIDSIINLQF